MSWRAMHIFYYDNQDTILKNDIKAVLKKNNVYEFFFIRYWENGPHIRLRLKNIDDSKFLAVKSEILDYMENNKSEVEIDENKYGEIADVLGKREGIVLQNHCLEKNNTIKEWKYEPELKKYSGKEGVALAEREFIHSSKIALDVIQLDLKQSLKYIFASVYAVDVSCALFETREQREEFFKRYADYWIGFGENVSAAMDKYKKKVAALDLNIESLRVIKKYFGELKNYDVHKKLYEELKTIADEKDIMRFGFNFVHLFNNRIGIVPAEEAMVGITALKVMEKIDGEEIYNENCSPHKY